MTLKFYMLVDRAVVTTSDVSAWLQWTEKADVQVDNTETTDYHVSTVFLNADLSHGRGEPVCFETMVFCSESYLDRIPDDQSLDRRQYRYATWDEAVAGHAAVVEHLERQMADAISRAVESSGRPR